MDCNLPGSSVHGDSPGKNTGLGCHDPPPGDLPNPGIKTRSPTLWADCLPSEPPGKQIYLKMGTIKERNSKDLTEAEEIKKRWQEYTELYRKGINDSDNHYGVLLT